MPIEVEGLSKSFGDVSVLRSISEKFAEAQISVLLGASGCGKTTTLRCIAGLEQPNAGRIAIDGRVGPQASRFRADRGVHIPRWSSRSCPSSYPHG